MLSGLSSEHSAEPSGNSYSDRSAHDAPTPSTEARPLRQPNKKLRWQGQDDEGDEEKEVIAQFPTLSSQRSGVNRVQERWMAAAEKATGFNVSALATRFAKSKEAKTERLQNVIEAAVRDPVVLAQNAFLAHFARVRANAMPPSLKLCINPILPTECVVAFVLLLSKHGKTSS
jgi:hypothetical protein